MCPTQMVNFFCPIQSKVGYEAESKDRLGDVTLPKCKNFVQIQYKAVNILHYLIIKSFFNKNFGIEKVASKTTQFKNFFLKCESTIKFGKLSRNCNCKKIKIQE